MKDQKITNIKNVESKNLVSKLFKYLCIPLMVICSAASLFTDLQVFIWICTIFQVFLLWLAADFITGVIHWWEDTYGNPNWPILGKYVVEPNLIHHKHPAKLLEGSYWNRINTSFYAVMIVSAILWLMGIHSWHIYLCLLFCTQGNEIHAMSHRPHKLKGKITMFLQKTGIFQSRQMHRWHHKAPYETNFCVMTDFVNPMLNKIDFWKKVEWIILKVFGIDTLRCSPVRKGL